MKYVEAHSVLSALLAVPLIAFGGTITIWLVQGGSIDAMSQQTAEQHQKERLRTLERTSLAFPTVENTLTIYGHDY